MRFSYVEFDATSAAQSAAIRKAMVEVERLVLELTESRPRSLALTKLEEAYMWVGKAIRDEQVARVGR